jgi:hypothetical protein
LYLDRGYLEPFSILFIGALILCKRVVDQVKVGLADDINGQSPPFSDILSSGFPRNNQSRQLLKSLCDLSICPIWGISVIGEREESLLAVCYTH